MTKNDIVQKFLGSYPAPLDEYQVKLIDLVVGYTIGMLIGSGAKLPKSSD